MEGHFQHRSQSSLPDPLDQTTPDIFQSSQSGFSPFLAGEAEASLSFVASSTWGERAVRARPQSAFVPHEGTEPLYQHPASG